MKRKWLRAVPALTIGLTALALASPALAHDPYCTRSRAPQDVYADEHRSHGHATDRYARPYEGDGSYAQQDSYADEDGSNGYGSDGYAGPYGEDAPYAQYGYSQRSYSHYGYTQEPYSQYGYGQRPYSQHDRNGYRRYGTGVVHEDHIRTRFNPFPLPHFEKRIIHHHHPD